MTIEAVRQLKEKEDASSGWTTSSWVSSLDVSQPLAGVLTRSALLGVVEEVNREAAAHRLQSDVMEGRKQSATDELKAFMAKWKDEMSLPPSAVVDLLHSAAAEEAKNAVPMASIPADFDELGFFREKGKITESIIRRILDAHRLGGLAPTVWDEIERLQGKQSNAELLQEKFTMSGAGLLSYGGLNTFFGGLEAKIGAPDPKIEEAMAAEHLTSSESQQRLETSNYEILTTSEIEWRFVVLPDQPPPTTNGAWPMEDKLRKAMDASVGERTEEQVKLLASGAKPRQPMKINKLRDKLTEANIDLKAMQEPTVEDFEGFAARLYTGPLFVKYALAPPSSTTSCLTSLLPSQPNTGTTVCCAASTLRSCSCVLRWSACAVRKTSRQCKTTKKPAKVPKQVCRSLSGLNSIPKAQRKLKRIS